MLRSEGMKIYDQDTRLDLIYTVGCMNGRISRDMRRSSKCKVECSEGRYMRFVR